MDAPTRDSEETQLRLLLVEDSEADAKLAIWQLREAGFECSYRSVSTDVEMRSALRCALPDLILSDFNMPRFDGLSALAIARLEAPDVPFIFLSGTIGENRAIEALKHGATDYVLKGNPLRLVPAVERALKDVQQNRKFQVAEQHGTRLTGVLQLLSAVNAAVARIPSRDDLLSESCRLAHNVGGYALAMVALLNPITRMARAVGWAGSDFVGELEREFPVADSDAADESLMGRVIRTGATVLCEDIDHSLLPINGLTALVATGANSLACLPLTVDKTPVGALLVGTVAAGAMSQDELLLLNEIASNLSFALQYLDKQDTVRFLSYFDPLTALPKRALFCERLSRLATLGVDCLAQFAVAVFDIDHLSVINDSFGRHTGDRLLQCVAERLRGKFPNTEKLAHLGGGTFVTVSVMDRQLEHGTRTLHQEVTQIFDRPFDVDGREIVATVKCGIACYPENGHEPDELVQNAEAALKEAKTSGEQYLHHRIEMNSELARRVGLEHRLRAAVENQEFVLHYQPKLGLHTGKISSVEALLRWNDPESGLIAPAVFLPILESAGLMNAVGAWALMQATTDARRWRQQGLPAVRIAVNISPGELRQRNFAHDVLAIVGSLANDSAGGIDIEVTEGALVGDSSICVQALRVLRAAGLRIAIDDFGKGYSSLGRLSDLPIDTLKIDQHFIARVPDDLNTCTLVATIIDLAHAFNMTTVAEGVETQAQLDYLIQAGCDESQGYLHSRPMAAADFELLLAKHAEYPGLAAATKC